MDKPTTAEIQERHNRDKQVWEKTSVQIYLWARVAEKDCGILLDRLEAAEREFDALGRDTDEWQNRALKAEQRIEKLNAKVTERSRKIIPLQQRNDELEAKVKRNSDAHRVCSHELFDVEQIIKQMRKLAEHYERFGENCPQPAKKIYQNIGCEIKDKLDKQP